MRKIQQIIILSLLFNAYYSSAQWRSVSTNDGTIPHRIDDGTNITYTLINRMPDKETILGISYIDSNFKDAKVNNGDKTFKLRYNNNTGFFEFEDEKKELVSISKDQNKVISFTNGETYFLKKISNSKDSQEEYLKIIGNINANVKVYSLERIKFIEGKTGKNSYEKSEQSEFKKMKPQFFIEYDDKLQAFSNISDLIKLFPNKKEELKKYGKSNSLRFDTTADVTKLQRFLASLL